MTNKIYGMIGFARKSGNLLLGYDAVTDGIKNKKVVLVICSSDSSEKIREKVARLCDINTIKCLEYGLKIEIGSILNKSEVSFIGICDVNMADYIMKHY
jgi:ribosomal protein L7Ae-like RNA K-turn-binding protein